jgi:hypothetical protein
MREALDIPVVYSVRHLGASENGKEDNACGADNACHENNACPSA